MVLTYYLNKHLTIRLEKEIILSCQLDRQTLTCWISCVVYKNKIYATQPTSIADFKETKTIEILNISPQTLNNVRYELLLMNLTSCTSSILLSNFSKKWPISKTQSVLFIFRMIRSEVCSQVTEIIDLCSETYIPH